MPRKRIRIRARAHIREHALHRDMRCRSCTLLENKALTVILQRMT